MRKTNFFFIDIGLEFSFKKTSDPENKQYSVHICVHAHMQDLTTSLCTVCMWKAHLQPASAHTGKNLKL